MEVYEEYKKLICSYQQVVNRGVRFLLRFQLPPSLKLRREMSAGQACLPTFFQSRYHADGVLNFISLGGLTAKRISSVPENRPAVARFETQIRGESELWRALQKLKGSLMMSGSLKFLGGAEGRNPSILNRQDEG
jgi:hypothetical protein